MKFKRISFTTLLFMSMLACSISTPVSDTPESSTEENQISKESRLTKAQVFFWVEIPENTPEGENLNFVIVDEVTGIPYNAERYEMILMDENHFGFTIQVQVGTLLKYYYEREGSGNILNPEFTNWGEPVRYRTYYVDGPGEIHEIIARWRDTTAVKQTGRIEGQILDKDMELGVGNLLVTAGGMETLTLYDGSFSLTNLPEGQHNVTVHSLDGSYYPIKQNAKVAAKSETPVSLQITKTRTVPVKITVYIPEDTPQVAPLRIAGNIYQLGNSNIDLGGGFSGLVSRMPVMAIDSPGIYVTTLELPVGIDINYKYTLGDGYWNAEQNNKEEFVVRKIFIPEDATSFQIIDEVESWDAGKYSKQWFYVTTPQNTPPEEMMAIQFLVTEWTAPIPMWLIGDNQWAFLLISPTNVDRQLYYRYCRNGVCGDEKTIASEGVTRIVSLTRLESKPKVDRIEAWNNYAVLGEKPTVLSVSIHKRGNDFIAGISISPDHVPSGELFFEEILNQIKKSQANLVIFRPSWTVLDDSPLVIEPIIKKDPSWKLIGEGIRSVQNNNVTVGIFPYLDYSRIGNDWEEAYTVNNGMWPAWFDRYRLFILHHAALAEETGTDVLIMDGYYIALAGEMIPERDWLELLQEIRDVYHGELGLHIPFEWLNQSPSLIFAFEQIYIHWGVPLATWSEATEEEILARVEILLDEGVKPFKERFGKKLILSIDYPSVVGGMTNCVSPNNDGNPCIPPSLLSPLNPDISSVELDMQEQVDVYNAILAGINERGWIDGVVSENYFLPLSLYDKSSSIHGKPAEQVFTFWLINMLGE